MVGLVVVDRGVGPVAPPETASAASVSSEMRAAFARVRTLRFELREVVQDADGARAVWRYSVSLDASGSYRVLSRRDSRTEVYDAARGTLRTLQRGPDAGTSELPAARARAPRSHRGERGLDRTLGSAIRAIASARPSAVQQTTYAGRRSGGSTRRSARTSSAATRRRTASSRSSIARPASRSSCG